MKLVRYDGGRIGVVRGDAVIDASECIGLDRGEFPPVGMVRLIRQFDRLKPRLEALSGATTPLAAVHLETPVPWPNKLIAFPVNYHAHQEETGLDYTAPSRGFFLKANSSLCGASEPIILPELVHEIHHEAELGVIIGREVRNISRSEALDCVFGYACLLDITVRHRPVERVMRKSYDTFTPIGPWIVTADEIADPAKLDMKLWVGSELRQHANTSSLILDLPEMITMAASAMTLYPGDIIATGTPGGVGPISHGDTVTIDIEQVGRMSVPVVQGRGGSNIALQEKVA